MYVTYMYVNYIPIVTWELRSGPEGRYNGITARRAVIPPRGIVVPPRGTTTALRAVVPRRAVRSST